MSEEEMKQELLIFGNTRAYQAVTQYFKGRSALALSGIASIDPFKNPTEMARQQGILMGLSDLTDMVKLLQNQVAEAEAASNAENTNGGE